MICTLTAIHRLDPRLFAVWPIRGECFAPLRPSIALTGGDIFQIRYRFQRCNILDLGAVENERNPFENMPSSPMFFENFVRESGWPNVLHLARSRRVLRTIFIILRRFSAVVRSTLRDRAKMQNVGPPGFSNTA